MEMIVITLVVLFVIGALFIIPRSHNSKGKANGGPSNVNGKTARTYTKKEVSLHNTRKDCWIIIKDKVYDVTPYVEEHPGGDAILNNAGGDSTEGFYGFVPSIEKIDEQVVGVLASGLCFFGPVFPSWNSCLLLFGQSSVKKHK